MKSLWDEMESLDAQNSGSPVGLIDYNYTSRTLLAHLGE